MQESMRICNHKRSLTVVDAESQSIQTKRLRAHTALDTSLKRTTEYTEAVTQNADLEMTKQPKIGVLFDSDKTKRHTKC